MPGFFEKKIMAAIETKLRSAWARVHAAVIPSDYNPDGLALRVWANDMVFFDLTIFNGKWTSILGGVEDGMPLLVRDRMFDELLLPIGAAAKLAAAEWQKYLGLNWNSAQDVKAAIWTAN